jgi:DNA-binding NarL/FixJ family response regulator
MKRVLVVESHPHVSAALADLVEEEPGFELAGVATTSSEAISLAGDLRPDVLLVDTDAPGWRAQRLDRRLGELLPMALIVLVSAATDPQMGCPKSSAGEPLIGILKTAAPEFLRSLTA